jgi:hypothetical protein
MTQETAHLLYSEGGLMELVPQFKGSDGHFAVPDPTVSLRDFFLGSAGTFKCHRYDSCAAKSSR